MKREFIREINSIEVTKIDTYQELLKHLKEIKQNLESDYNNLQYIQDQNLVDYYTYKIKSDEAKYDYLLREAKKREE